MTRSDTRVCFNVGEEDAVALAPLFASSSDPDEVRRRADDLMNLHRYQGFLKSTVNGRPLPPTTFNLPKPFNLMFSENEQTVMKQTIKNLCRPKADVLAEQRAFAARTELVVSISESLSEDNEEKGLSEDGYQQPQGAI